MSTAPDSVRREDVAAVFVSTEDLRPWEDNPRLNTEAIPEIAESIRRFGFGAPIIARESDGMIIAGHTRFEAAKSIGMDRVPVRFLDLTEKEARALALADNKLGEIAYWSDDLADLLAEMADEEIDLSGLGWSGAEIDSLLDSLPDFIGEERIAEIRDTGNGARENGNMTKIQREGSGARVVVLGDFRTVVAGSIYRALSDYLEAFEDTQEGISTLLGDALGVDRASWHRED